MRELDGGAAFPVPAWTDQRQELKDPVGGMTLRQWYKGAALKGLLAYPDPPGNTMTKGDVVALAAEYADLMLAEDAATQEAGRED